MKINKKQLGFTLIEILVVIGIIAILAAVVIIAINPARQFAQARDSQRSSNVNAILNAVWQRMVDNRGVWDSDCGGGVSAPIAASPSFDVIGTGDLNLAPCLVPTYLPQMVYDPNDGSEADTKYRIFREGTGGRITVEADGEVPAGTTIRVTR